MIPRWNKDCFNKAKTQADRKLQRNSDITVFKITSLPKLKVQGVLSKLNECLKTEKKVTKTHNHASRSHLINLFILLMMSKHKQIVKKEEKVHITELKALPQVDSGVWKAETLARNTKHNWSSRLMFLISCNLKS